MSHDGTWRASCRITIPVPLFHFGITLQRTRRDKSRRWLWRLVRPFLVSSTKSLRPQYPTESGFTHYDATLLLRILGCDSPSIRLDFFSRVPVRPSRRVDLRGWICSRCWTQKLRRSDQEETGKRAEAGQSMFQILEHGRHNRVQSLPNVKDEPRPWLARRVHRGDLDSEFSFEDA